ncbi:MAG: 5-formyltetrahydrofolate cyclo-ligase [Coriobacteriales bacterium]|jgi:5-formyltetrahydrofolate cyclo-ligase|nr:5-formyltetrahydrofolate cyclo-ligase [Coriobacteriales bacterium]
MQTPLYEPDRKTRPVLAGLCFSSIIAAGWVLALWLVGDLNLAAIDATVLYLVEQSVPAAGPSTSLYAFIIVTSHAALSSVMGPGAAAFLLITVQGLAIPCACVWALLWLYGKGAPLWLVLILALGCAALLSLARVVVEPNGGTLSVALLFVLTLWLVDAVADNCGRLRRVLPRLFLFVVIALLPLLEPSLLVVSVVTLIAIAFTPTRIKARLFLWALPALVLVPIILFMLFPRLGWTIDALSYLRDAFTFNAVFLHALPLVPTALVLVWVLLNRRPRYALPFVPLIAFGLLALFLQPRHLPEAGLLASLFLLCLAFLAQVPLIREYRDDKWELRARFATARAAVPEEERGERAELACATLLARLQERVAPTDGYVGLYMARGGEMPVEPLAVALGALGYHIAYPALSHDREMAFYTTIGVNNEALFDALVRGEVGALDFGKLNRVEPSEMIALVVPGLVFDKDCYCVGRGEGHYDRYLAQMEKEILAWGIGFREQLVESVPVEPHDKALSGIVVV